MKYREKTNIALCNLEYEEEYTKAYKNLNFLFDKDLIDLCLKTLSEEYSNNFSKGIDLPNAIFNGLIFDYDTYRGSLKEITPNVKTLESRVGRMRKKLGNLNKPYLYEIILKKVLPRIEKEFKEQITW